MPEPIVVIGCPRSGTSMTAGLVHLMGAWVGTCRPADEHNPKGYFENRRLAELFRRWHGIIINRGLVPPTKAGWLEAVRAQIRLDGYRDGPWVVKQSALYWRAWGECAPLWIKCRRETEAIMASCRRSGALSGDVKRLVGLHNAVMDRLPGFDVDTAAVAHGDFSTVVPPLEAAGLAFDEAKGRAFVEASLWHWGGPTYAI